MAEIQRHDGATERALLGAILINNALWDDIEGLVDVEDFFSVMHRHLWRAFRLVARDGQIIGPVTVPAALTAEGRLKEAGGDQYLLGLAADAPIATTEAVEGYVRTLHRWRALRSVAGVCREALGSLGTIAADDAAERWAASCERDLSHALAPLRLHLGPKRGEQTIAQAATRALADLAAPPRDDMIACATGLPEIDELALLPSFSVVGAKTKHGKSTLAATLTRLRCGAGLPVYYVHAEDPTEVLVYRLVTQETGISVRRVEAIARRIARDPDAESDERQIRDALGRLQTWPLVIDDDPAPSAESIRYRLRERARQGCSLCIVDHAHELARHPGLDERESLARSIKTLRDAALETGVPIVLLAQIHRMTGRDGPPSLSDLHGTGKFEQAARLVILLHRPDQDRAKEDEPRRPQPVRVEIAAASNGRTGVRWLMFDPRRMWFRRCAPAELEVIRASGGDPKKLDELWTRAGLRWHDYERPDWTGDGDSSRPVLDGRARAAGKS